MGVKLSRSNFQVKGKFGGGKSGPDPNFRNTVAVPADFAEEIRVWPRFSSPEFQMTPYGKFSTLFRL